MDVLPYPSNGCSKDEDSSFMNCPLYVRLFVYELPSYVLSFNFSRSIKPVTNDFLSFELKTQKSHHDLHTYNIFTHFYTQKHISHFFNHVSV